MRSFTYDMSRSRINTNDYLLYALKRNNSTSSAVMVYGWVGQSEATKWAISARPGLDFLSWWWLGCRQRPLSLPADMFVYHWCGSHSRPSSPYKGGLCPDHIWPIRQKATWWKKERKKERKRKSSNPPFSSPSTNSHITFHREKNLFPRTTSTTTISLFPFLKILSLTGNWQSRVAILKWLAYFVSDELAGEKLVMVAYVPGTWTHNLIAPVLAARLVK